MDWTARHGAKADLAAAGPPRQPAAPPPDLPVRVLQPGPLEAAEVVEGDPGTPAASGRRLSRRRRSALPAQLPAEPAPFAAPPAQLDEPAPPGRRRRRQAGSAPVPDVGVQDLPAPQGYAARRSARKARRGWYAPLAAPALTYTWQAEILNTALVAPPTGTDGIFVGRDRLSNSPVAHDPFTAYQRGTITSPAVVVLGVIGSGKSSLLKTVYVLRPLILRDRRAVVMDRKDSGGQGEYAEPCRSLGAEPLRMVLGGGGTTLNILDPVVLAGAASPARPGC